MNRLIFIRLFFTVLLTGPLLCLASTDLKTIDMHDGVTSDVSIEVTMSAVKFKALSMETMQSQISFALSSLFTNVFGTLTATFDLVVAVISYVFISTGSELAKNANK